jgi:hypothetical protein
MGLDAEGVKRINGEDLRQREEALALDIGAGVEIRGDDELWNLSITDYTTLPLNGIEYARLLFEAYSKTKTPKVVEVNASSAFRIDTNMHGLLRFENNGQIQVVAFNQQSPVHRFELNQAGGWARWLTFVSEGAWHIWVGFDHMLFLIVLLLPAVLKREGNQWAGAGRFQEALINVVKIVTAFTIAHSITLTLSVLGIVRLPTRLVESAIAASVALAALNNLLPGYRGRGWLIALCFGLIHGFGFANVLMGLELSGGVLGAALVGFNVGVELGQLAIVLGFLPLAFHLRQSMFYRTVTLKLGSSVLLLIATAWMFERLFGRQLIGF